MRGGVANEDRVLSPFVLMAVRDPHSRNLPPPCAVWSWRSRREAEAALKWVSWFVQSKRDYVLQVAPQLTRVNTASSPPPRDHDRKQQAGPSNGDGQCKNSYVVGEKNERREE